MLILLGIKFLTFIRFPNMKEQKSSQVTKRGGDTELKRDRDRNTKKCLYDMKLRGMVLELPEILLKT